MKSQVFGVGHPEFKYDGCSEVLGLARKLLGSCSEVLGLARKLLGSFWPCSEVARKFGGFIRKFGGSHAKTTATQANRAKTLSNLRKQRNINKTTNQTLKQHKMCPNLQNTCEFIENTYIVQYHANIEEIVSHSANAITSPTYVLAQPQNAHPQSNRRDLLKNS